MITLNQVRGVPFAMPQNPSLEAFQAIWSNMFFNQETDRKISFKFIDSVPTTRSLKIFFEKGKAFTSIPEKGDAGPSNVIPLKFERSISGNTSAAYATVNSQGLPYLQARPEIGPVTGFFHHSLEANVQETARSFSQLAMMGKEGPIIETLKEGIPFHSRIICFGFNTWRRSYLYLGA